MEQQFKWCELEEEQQLFVCASHSYAFGLKPENLNVRRVFDLGTPDVVLGHQDGKAYCRIAPQSKDVMKLLFREYVLK